MSAPDLLSRARTQDAPPGPSGMAWIITDGKAGDRLPAVGIAERLGLHPIDVTVTPGFTALTLARIGVGTLAALPEQASDVSAEQPRLILGSGRRAVPALLALRQKWQTRVPSVFLKEPNVLASVADIVWVPAHDRLRGPNVMATATAPHRFTAAFLAEHRKAFTAQYARRPKPWLGVMLGGVSGRMRYPDDDVARAVHGIQQAADTAGTVFVSASRRTPEPLRSALRDILNAQASVFWAGPDDGPNPFAGMLATCDAFFVTGDSHNMVSECLVAGRPVMVFRPRGLPAKFARFLDGLEREGLISGPGVPDWSTRQEPVDSTDAIAEAIRRRLLSW